MKGAINNNGNKKKLSPQGSANTSPKPRRPDGEMHFSSSAFLNSPDPSRVPIPIFEDDAIHALTVKPSNIPKASAAPKAYPVDQIQSSSVYDSGVNKTAALRQFLNIRPQVAAGST